MTLGQLAREHEELRPKTRSRVRVCFEYLRFTPHGEVKAVVPGMLTLLQGKLHAKRYAFDGSDHLTSDTPCWVWTLNDERAEAASFDA